MKFKGHNISTFRMRISPIFFHNPVTIFFRFFAGPFCNSKMNRRFGPIVGIVDWVASELAASLLSSSHCSTTSVVCGWKNQAGNVKPAVSISSFHRLLNVCSDLDKKSESPTKTDEKVQKSHSITVFKNALTEKFKRQQCTHTKTLL